MPTLPFPISGVVRNSAGSVVASQAMELLNETTGEKVTGITTNAQGQYIFNLANLTSGYSTGDTIRIRALTGSNPGQVLLFKAVCKTNFAQIDSFDLEYEV